MVTPEKALQILVDSIRNAEWDGRHDGLGSRIFSIDIYQETAIQALNEIERLRQLDMSHVHSGEN